jgi:galactokinase
MVRATAPGRVNLIGDHTDYVGGKALPMAIDLRTEVSGERGGDRIELWSDAEVEPALVSLTDPLGSSDRPDWARYVEGVVAVVKPGTGFRGRIRSTVPPGSGLSSSAALELSVALAIGFEGTPVELAKACQEAEQLAAGVPCGIMDQLCGACGVEGHALLIDFDTLELEPIPIGDDVEVVVVHSGEPRSLAGSAYAQRRAQCEEAEHHIGPLRQASQNDVGKLGDAVLRRRARHVISENRRVDDFAAAMGSHDYRTAGRLMIESHLSLRDDFEVSTSRLDELVARLTSTGGVHGARLTGAGFGGCVVALTERGVLDEGWHVRPSGGAELFEP